MIAILGTTTSKDRFATRRSTWRAVELVVETPVAAAEVPREKWEAMLLGGGVNETVACAVAEVQDAHTRDGSTWSPAAKWCSRTPESPMVGGILPGILGQTGPEARRNTP